MSRKVRSNVTSISSGEVGSRENWGTTWDNSRWSHNSSAYEPSTTNKTPTGHSQTYKSKDYCKRECISIHLGQAGVQISSACWQLYCLEHNIGCDGRSLDSIDGIGGEPFFQETESGKYVPRAVLVDLEPSVVDEVRSGVLRDLYHPDYMLTGLEDAANNFARGYLTVGTSMIVPVVDWIRRMAENCDSLQGFFLYHSLGGGTGSGFTALMLETLEHEFRKKCKLEFIVYPSPLVSSAIVEPYNAVMTTSFCLDYIDCAFMVDNEALYEACVLKLDINRPNLTQLNRIIAQVASSVTASLRFKGALNMDMNEFQTNLVPFPHLHYPVTSYAPLLSHRTANHENASVKDITSSCFDGSHQLVKCNMSKGEYIACCLLYRGDVTPKDVNASIARVKMEKDIKFVDWSPTGFKVGINYQMPCMGYDVNMAQVRRAVCMMSNNTAIAEVWRELTNKFDLMYMKRAFVHWYNAEGMCDSTIELARDHVADLRMDYEQLSKPLDELSY